MAFKFLENKFEGHYLNIDTGTTTRAPNYYEKKPSNYRIPQTNFISRRKTSIVQTLKT